MSLLIDADALRDAGRTSVVIVDDHLEVAQAVASALQVHADLQVVDIVGSCCDAVLAVQRLRPDVVVLDYKLPDCSGTDLLPKLLEVSPDTRVLILTAVDDDDVRARAVAAGAAAVVLKSGRGAELVRAVRASAGQQPVITA